jgi:hypothetical protein
MLLRICSPLHPTTNSRRHETNPRSLVMIDFDGPHAMLLLKEMKQGSFKICDLLLPLTITYLCSSQIRFCSPIPCDSVHTIDRAFDLVLKRMPLCSKGVSYVFDFTSETVHEMLSQARLTITTDESICDVLNSLKAPYIFISSPKDDQNILYHKFIERIKYPGLKRVVLNLNVFVQVISSVTFGQSFVSRELRDESPNTSMRGCEGSDLESTTSDCCIRRPDGAARLEISRPILSNRICR